MLDLAIQWFRDRGHTVEAADRIPGLYHLNGGPEMTTGQFISMWLHISDALPLDGAYPSLTREGVNHFLERYPYP